MKIIKISLFLIMVLSIQNLYSQNGWFQQFSAGYLKSITCINSHTGWAFAQSSNYDTRVYRTYDGSNWNLICSTFSFLSRHITFNNELSGILPSVRNLFYYTIDGTYWYGSCPYAFPPCPGNSEWTAATITDNGITYMVGLAYDNINHELRSAVVFGGGTSFTNYYYISNDNVMLNNIKATDNNNIWFVGNSGRVIKFPVTRYILNENANFTGVSFPDPSNGYVIGGSYFYKTTNGGGNWTQIPSPQNGSYPDVYFTNKDTGWVTGVIPGTGGAVLRTTNGGLNWTLQCAYEGIEICFANSFIGWVVCGGVVIKTVTGGEPMINPPLIPNLKYPNDTLISSTTPTLTWDDTFGATSYGIQISTDTALRTIVMDTSGVLITSVQVPAGRLLPGNTYYWRIRGNNNIGYGPWSFYRHFTLTPVPPAPNLFSPLNGSTGVSLTPLLDWASVQTASSYKVQLSVDSIFSSPILDSSVSVDSILVPSNILVNNTRYYWRINATNIIGTGPWSTIWHFNTLLVGTGNNYTEIPKEFKLYTNYPNPFNPTTIIKFDIPKEIHVKIVIYDIQGKTIQTLLESKVNAGKYEIEWNGTNYPSGVYFYKMETGEYTSVKKMVLLK